MWPSVNRAFLKARLPRRMYLDLLILPFSLWLAFVFHYDGFWPAVMEKHSWLLFASPAIALPIFVRFGMYRAVPAYASTKAFYSIVRALTLQTCLLVMTAYIGRLQGVSMTVFAIYWFVSISLIGSSRILLRSLLIWLQRIKHPPQNVVIYGAGSAGAELAETLQAGQDFLPMAFIDDKHELHGKEIRGVKVYPTDKLDVLIPKTGAKQILLAIPSAKRARRKAIVSYLEKFPVHVRTVPALADIVSGRSKIQELREIDLEDVLGREPVPPDQRLLSACITGKSVLVTGAGGSIGSELCRQIVQLQPSQIVLFEASEFALYRIDRTLREICTSGKKHLKDIEIVPIIGSVTNEHKLKLVINTFAIQTVYHAAAYKHVPLVEHNPIEGVKNNVFGTWCTAKTVVDANIETFVLISTDKAVRPTNVMGATKRLAEIYVQALARESNNTRMSIVRFGNVLGSSGSVVPLFRRQIQNGGPITLTHPEMTRYFMTIPEAAQLVIQAGAMAQGCDVFVLDMGNPVRILDLARRMISLSGLTVRDTDNPDGDINIEITCPRPGEKLCEELVLGDNITTTDHPSILRANEMDLPLEKVLYIQDQLESSCTNYNIVAVRELLQDIIEGYVPQCGIEDFVWIASQRLNSGTHDVVNY